MKPLSPPKYPQSGAFLLVLVLILGFTACLALTAYFTLLTHTTRTLAGQVHAEQAHYAVFAAFSESLAHYRQQPQWLTDLPDLTNQTIVYPYTKIPITRRLTRIGPQITLDVTSTVIQTQRRLQANFFINQPNFNPADIIMLIDRSGSMADDGTASLPHPCSVQTETKDPMVSAICASQDFVDVFINNANVQIAVVPFATQTEPLPELPHLTQHQTFAQIIQAISNIQVANCHNNNCYPTTGGAINRAISLLGEINYANPNDLTQRVIVLFTDGIPTVNANGQFCDQYDNQPPCDTQQQYARDQAQIAKEDYLTTIYTIGLGNNVNHQLLTEIASTPDHYHFAPDKSQLSEIFTDIALEIQSLTAVKLEELLPGELTQP